MTSVSAVKRRVAANIKRCRQRACLSQEAFAKKLGVSLRYASMLEQNPRNLGIESLHRIASCLDVDIAEIVCDPKFLDSSKRAAAELGIELLQQYLESPTE